MSSIQVEKKDDENVAKCITCLLLLSLLLNYLVSALRDHPVLSCESVHIRNKTSHLRPGIDRVKQVVLCFRQS